MVWYKIGCDHPVATSDRKTLETDGTVMVRRTWERAGEDAMTTTSILPEPSETEEEVRVVGADVPTVKLSPCLCSMVISW